MKWSELDMEKQRYLLLCLLLAAALLAAGISALAPWEKEEEPLVIEARTEASEAAPAVVYISGAVRRPGVYDLPQGSRVYEAVKAAGDVLPYADMEAVNLAAPVEDGEKIHIPVHPEQTAQVPEGAHLVNINYASQAELETLPGIGEVTAAKILQYRREHGLFEKKEELMEVPSIGEGKYSKLEHRITL